MDIQAQKEYLQSLPNRQTREFYEGLRTLLKTMYRYQFADISQVVNEFQTDILQHGVFYIDIVNENLFFILKRASLLPPLQINLFLLIMETLLPVCNRKTLALLRFFSKKVDRRNASVFAQVEVYRESIQARLEKMERALKTMVLHPYKDIFQEYNS